MRTDSVENLKRALLHVRRNRFLWPIAFLMALAGGGLQGFSLWLQSPFGTGLAGSSPLHHFSGRVTDYARGNPALWTVFLASGLAVGLAAVAFGAFAQASAIGAVAELESGREADLRGSLRWGRRGCGGLFLLALAYLVLLGMLLLPLRAVTSASGAGVLLPCLAWLVLGTGYVVVSVAAGIVLEVSARYLVLEDSGIRRAVVSAWRLFRREWRDCLLTWFYVMLISLAGFIATAALMGLLATVLVPLFNASYRHHSPAIIMLGMLGFFAAWAIAAAVTGVFSMTGSAMWTGTFLELDRGGAVARNGEI